MTLVVVAVLAGLVGLMLGWVLHRLSVARRQRRAGGGIHVAVLESEVARLEARTAELDALLVVTGQDSTRLHAELAAAYQQSERLASDLAGLMHERDGLEAALAEERSGRAADRAAHEAAVAAADERAAARAAEADLAQARARDAETELAAERARVAARDAALGDLQQRVAELEAATRPAPEPDDLHLIDGVGRVLEGMLHEAGITTYRQLADLAADGGPDGRLEEFLGRIRNEGWSAQARELHRLKYGDDPANAG